MGIKAIPQILGPFWLPLVSPTYIELSWKGRLDSHGKRVRGHASVKKKSDLNEKEFN
jgi:hypothetical protein